MSKPPKFATETVASVLLVLDAPVGARPDASGFLSVGQAALPLSPALALLASEGGALPVRFTGAWSRGHVDAAPNRIADTAALATVESCWIDAHRVY
jgi:hypothetical protein